MTSDHEKWRFYGRRAGRKLNAARQSVLDELFPELEIKPEQLTEDQSLAPSSLFSSSLEKTVLEIGFGNGEHLVEMMRRTSDTAFIGAEPFFNGMSAFLKQVQDENIPTDNVRVLMDDAMILVRSLEANCLDEIYILNPDPWHKTRHHKRRIVNPDNLNEFSRLLKPGGKLIMSTDVPDLAEWMVTHAINHPDFKWEAECADDWRRPPKDWIPTRYETKRAKGADKMVYLFFRKIS
ncbi:MAG: tRNA (guanosine(46)-N7)-methyltransferase TrmB [Alphaproteobacteria bacterium]|nr:tRNA (guanosine(46)-N7)-methyltransferase TrmB [Alphaproteobacteria bacterium]